LDKLSEFCFSLFFVDRLAQHSEGVSVEKKARGKDKTRDDQIDDKENNKRKKKEMEMEREVNLI